MVLTACVSIQLVIEAEGSSHFYRRTRRFTATSRLKHRLLTEGPHAYTLLHIPHWEWRQIPQVDRHTETHNSRLHGACYMGLSLACVGLIGLMVAYATKPPVEKSSNKKSDLIFCTSAIAFFHLRMCFQMEEARDRLIEQEARGEWRRPTWTRQPARYMDGEAKVYTSRRYALHALQLGN